MRKYYPKNDCNDNLDVGYDKDYYPRYHHHRHPHIKNENNPVITIFNNVRCDGCCDDSVPDTPINPPETPINPPEPSRAKIMAYDSDSFGGITDEWKLISELAVDDITKDPRFITAEMNWVPELFDGYPCATSMETIGAPIAELMLTRADDLGNEVELRRVLEAAVAMNMPAVTRIGVLDEEDLTGKAAVYKLYARIDKAVMNGMTPYEFMVRQYPQKKTAL